MDENRLKKTKTVLTGLKKIVNNVVSIVTDADDQEFYELAAILEHGDFLKDLNSPSFAEV